MLLINQFNYCLSNMTKWSVVVFLFLMIFLMILATVTNLRMIFFRGTREVELNDNYKLIGDNIVSYIVTYLIPFMTLDLRNLPSVISNLLLFSLIASLYVRYDLEYLNPILGLAGYRVFVSTGDGRATIITRISADKLKQMKDNNIVVKKKVIVSDVFLIKPVD